MADNKVGHGDMYEPDWSNPGRSSFNQVGLENLSGNKQADSQNLDNGKVQFDINDIRSGQEEYSQGEDGFQILDVDHILDYFNSLVHWIVHEIHIPQDSEALRKKVNLLRLNCQYSHANTTQLRLVNVVDTLVRALRRHFDMTGVRNGSEMLYGRVESVETLNFCREIVKLLEILGFTTDTPSLSETLCGIMRIVYFEGGDSKDMGRIVRILHAILYDVRMPLFDIYYPFILHQLQNTFALSSELSLCSDVTNRFLSLSNDNPPWTISPLCKALETLVSRIRGEDENYRVNEEYGDQCAALENVMKVLCRLCFKYGLQTVLYMSRADCGVLGQIKKILKHALLHPRPGARSFKGKHLLYALLLAKYIYDRPGGNSIAGPEDVKVVLDFAMSDLPARYLFNGLRRLKDLADVMVPIVLESDCAEFVLDNWSAIDNWSNI